MALCSQADWYGQHLHPVFLLPHDEQLQQRLQQHGVQGVAQAAAAASRLLEAASAGVLPVAEDVTAVRQFAASLEEVQRQVHSSAGGELHGEVLIPTRPWWMKLSEKFSGSMLGDSSSNSVSSISAGGVSGMIGQQPQHHANHTAALAFERAVMAERNAVLTDALWEQAAAAADAAHTASASSSSWLSKAASSLWSSSDTAPKAAAAAAAAPAAVLGVVGVNHLPGIVQEWRRREQQWHAQQQQDSIPTSSSSDYSYNVQHFADVDHQLQQHAALRLAATDAAAGVLEMCAVGSIGLAYLFALGKLTQPASAAAAAARSAGAAAAAARWGGQQVALGGSSKLQHGFAAAGAAAAAGAVPCATRFAHSATTSGSSNSSSSSSSSSVGRSWLLGGLSKTALNSRQIAPQVTAAVANAHSCRGSARVPRSCHLARLGLLLLPVGVALLPLQRDAGRLQEASQLLHSIAVVNDEMLSQGQLGGGMASLFELAGEVSQKRAMRA
jgi:hypothetical protein